MDSLASLALATDDPKPELLLRPPYRKTEYIISRKMTKHILATGIFQSIVLLVVLFTGPMFIPEDPTSSIIADHLLEHPVERFRNWNPRLVFNGMIKSVDG
jgi:magnesium-transporting ATPase (P-type)